MNDQTQSASEKRHHCAKCATTLSINGIGKCPKCANLEPVRPEGNRLTLDPDLITLLREQEPTNNVLAQALDRAVCAIQDLIVPRRDLMRRLAAV